MPHSTTPSELFTESTLVTVSPLVAVHQQVSDAEFLAEFRFRDDSHPALANAAQRGDPTAFARVLPQVYEQKRRIGKRERARLLGALQTLWTRTSTSVHSPLEPSSLADCLFDRKLTSDELSSRIESCLAGVTEGMPSRDALVAAFWLLRFSGKQLCGKPLEAQTYFALLRWTLESSQSWMNRQQADFPEQTQPEQGCLAFDFLEIQTLYDLCIPDLKKDRKQHRKNAMAWQVALDAITDTDGTPHARWLGEILSRIAQLAAISLFADSLNTSLWSKKWHSRLQGLLDRASVLLTPDHVLFNNLQAGPLCGALLVAAEVLQLNAHPGWRSLLVRWEEHSLRPEAPRSTNKVTGKVPDVCVQSDWAMWAGLRSSWSEPVDLCAVRHDGPTPQLAATVSDLPLFAGAWEHELKVDGQQIEPTGEWSCCCWYVDRQAAFVELQLNRENPVQVIRQALLLRNESVLMLADSVRLPEPGQIEFRRRLPIQRGWNLEEDTLSREQALCQQGIRVRLFPWSSPQMRIDRSDESTSVHNHQLELHAHTQGRGLFTSTLFDWSEKRRETPVDWRRVTVAEDGQIISPEVAVGYWLRLGKKQWVLYHSHQKPVFPRSVMGIHTLSETVFARLSNRGVVDVQVEVEL